MLPLSASASPVHVLPDFSAASLLATPMHLTMQRAPEAPATATVYAFARAGDTPARLAAAYGVDPRQLTVSPTAALKPGAVVPLKVTATRVDRQLPPGVLTHTVKPGETIGALAARYGLSTLELVSANLATESLDELAVGQEVLIPTRQRGLLVQVKPGQDALGLMRAYRADPVRVAQANHLASPTDLRAGDYLLLPGVRAQGLMTELLARRARAALHAHREAQLAQYQRYLAHQQAVQRQRALAAAALQRKYDAYQAYLKSPERRALQERYARQAQYQKFLAQQVEARRKLQAQQAARTPKGTPTLRQAAFGDAGIIWPMRSYRITSRFGERDIEFHQEFFHGGVDLAAPMGTPIHAATDGVVRQSGFGDFGLNVWVDDGDATVIYGHMSRTAVQAGQHVRQGELLGYVGCTGICTGPHLHFEVRLAGHAVDPLGLLP